MTRILPRFSRKPARLITREDRQDALSSLAFVDPRRVAPDRKPDWQDSVATYAKWCALICALAIAIVTTIDWSSML